MKGISGIKGACILLTGWMLLSMADDGSRYPRTYFSSPVNRQIKLSGTFGELRTNHFHAGLDIKSSNGISGDPVYTAADGFVSRIKVEEFGYGNALYIDHPNGFSTVYAHLDRFAPEIAAYVKAEQYRLKTFKIDLYLSKNHLPVTRANPIGVMGNTGSSFGPHLHFEIRHTAGQIPVNPLHFGFDITDRTPPVIQQLLLYEYNESGVLVRTSQLEPKRISSGAYTFDQIVTSDASMISFGLRTFDSHDGVSNKNGVYGISCSIDREPLFAFTLDEIPFEKTRYLNAHIDYPHKVKENKYFHRCHPLEGNQLNIYETGPERGIVYLNTEIPRKVEFAATDYNGNISRLSFDIIRQHNLSQTLPALASYEVLGSPDQIAIVQQPGVQVVWPKGSFYEKTPLSIERLPQESPDSFSPYFVISPTEAPVHVYFEILIEGLGVPPHLIDKVFIARCEPNGRIVNCGGKWIGNNLVTGVRQLSTYTIMMDTIPPTITPLHFGNKMSGWSRMAFKISDNFGIKDRGRDLLYDAWVDDEWILMSLDGKTGILTHEFDGRILPGEHRLRLRVIDDRGNQSIWERPFIL